MRIHNRTDNASCIGQRVCAHIGLNHPWVDYSDGNNGEENYYRDVYIDGHCAYMYGEICVIRGFDEMTNEVILYCPDGHANSDDKGWDGVIKISYEQYFEDFGLDWPVYEQEEERCV